MRELSLNVMDIVQNSVRAGASLITVQVAESKKHDTLTITITDNGCGMSAEQVKSVIDPFFTTRTTRKVGLGVPLFKMEAEMTGGSFQIDSEEGKGTKVTAVFSLACRYDPPRGHRVRYPSFDHLQSRTRFSLYPQR